jgi:methyltransferase
VVSLYVVFLMLLGAERVGELLLSRRNVAWALRRGGTELGRRHFRWMVLLHAAFLPACVLEVWALDRPFIPALGFPMLAAVLAAQGLRYWAVRTLGRRWSVRVIALPGEPVLAGGPYRFIRHPNYLAVILEGIAVPLVHTAWLTALVFTVLNLPLLGLRIRCEEAALAEHSDYRRRLGAIPRLAPSWSRFARQAGGSDRGHEGPESLPSRTK